MSHHPCGLCGERHFGDCLKSWRPDTDTPFKPSKQCEPTFKLTLNPQYRFELHHDWENETSQALSGWYAVSDSERGGIIAYFDQDAEAWSFIDTMRAKHNCDGIAALYERAHRKD